MPYDIEASSDGCYEGTTCLINKLDIRDEEELASVEAALTLANIGLLEQEPLEGRFDFAHYRAIHKFLFGELYDWAGEIRTVNLAKKGTQFVPANEIESVGRAIFERLAAMNFFCDDGFAAFIQHITEFYCDTNLVLLRYQPCSIAIPTFCTPFVRGTAGRSEYSWRSLSAMRGMILTSAAWIWMN